MQSSYTQLVGVVVFVVCYVVKNEAIESNSIRLLSLSSRIGGIRQCNTELRAGSGIDLIAWTRAPQNHLGTISRLRGGMALSDYFPSAKSSKEHDDDAPSDDFKKQIENVPIKWVVAGTVGGLCLLSSQIAHVLVLGYGVSYPAYCRFDCCGTSQRRCIVNKETRAA